VDNAVVRQAEGEQAIQALARRCVALLGDVAQLSAVLGAMDRLVCVASPATSVLLLKNFTDALAARATASLSAMGSGEDASRWLLRALWLHGGSRVNGRETPHPDQGITPAEAAIMAKIAKLRVSGTANSDGAFRQKKRAPEKPGARDECFLEARWWLGLALASQPDHAGAAKAAIGLSARSKKYGSGYGGWRGKELEAWAGRLKRRLRCTSGSDDPELESGDMSGGSTRPNGGKGELPAARFCAGFVAGGLSGLAIALFVFYSRGTKTALVRSNR